MMATIVTGDGSAALRQAVRQALLADAQLAPLLGPVRTRIPDGARFPITRLALSTIRWATQSFSGGEHQLTLDHWRPFGLEDWSAEAVDRLVALIDIEPLPLTGHSLASRRFERLDRLIEPETGLRRLRLEARMRTHPIL